MLIEIKRDICTTHPYTEIANIYVNPANIMTMEVSTVFKQRDIMGDIYFLELHLYLNNQDYLLYRQPIDKKDLDNTELIEARISDTVKQLEQLKEILENL